MDMLVALIFWCFIGGLIGYIIGKNRGREAEGFALGAVLGLLGWILILVGPDNRKFCNECKGVVPKDARKCMHCGSELRILVKTKCTICGEDGCIDERDIGQAFDCPTCRRSMVPKVLAD
jgi:hypothetical protein